MYTRCASVKLLFWVQELWTRLLTSLGRYARRESQEFTASFTTSTQKQNVCPQLQSYLEISSRKSPLDNGPQDVASGVHSVFLPTLTQEWVQGAVQPPTFSGSKAERRTYHTSTTLGSSWTWSPPLWLWEVEGAFHAWSDGSLLQEEAEARKRLWALGGWRLLRRWESGS